MVHPKTGNMFYEAFRPQRSNDPRELSDLGADPAFAAVRADLHERLFQWARNRRSRITISDADVAKRTDTHDSAASVSGFGDSAEGVINSEKVHR